MKAVVPQDNLPCAFADTNSGGLFSTAAVLEFCLGDQDVLCLSLNINSNPGLVLSGIANNAVLDPITMPREKLPAFVAKKNAYLSIPFECTASDEVVRIPVPNADSEFRVF